MRCVACVIVILGLVGCAAGPEKTAANKEGDGVICTYEVPTGSSIRERKCTTPEERADQQRQAEHQVFMEPGAGNAR
jgi:hypothetical protein